VHHLEVPVEVWLAGTRRTVVRVAREPRIVLVEIDPEALFPELERDHKVWTPEGAGGAPPRR
jgi:hypothetical protein